MCDNFLFILNNGAKLKMKFLYFMRNCYLGRKKVCLNQNGIDKKVGHVVDDT